MLVIEIIIQKTNFSSSNIGNFTLISPELVNTLAFSLGGFLGIYIIFQVIQIYIRYKELQKINEMKKKVDEIHTNILKKTKKIQKRNI